jgi:N-formylglutamate deformylase
MADTTCPSRHDPRLISTIMSNTGILLHIPHASTVIPSEWRSVFLLGDELLKEELITMTDAFTDELFDLGSKTDRLEFPVSRLLVDPERFPEDADEPMSSNGMGAVYTKTHDGRPLKHDNQRAKLMEEYYFPHHTKLEDWVQFQLDYSGRCLIIDCHSYPSMPISCDLNQEPNRSDICLGTTEPHTPADLVATSIRAFESFGYSVAVDTPYAGTIVPLRFFGTESRVSSMMIEVNRKLYMDELTGLKNENFHYTKSNVLSCLESIFEHWTSV